MDASELRALQAPLKQLYKSDPASAMTPLAARSDYRMTQSPALSAPRRGRSEPACTRRLVEIAATRAGVRWR
jgi:hypothetical protein